MTHPLAALIAGVERLDAYGMPIDQTEEDLPPTLVRLADVLAALEAAMQAEREAALQELRFHVDDAVKAWNAHEAAEATVASLQAQVEAMRGALEQIAWSNDSKWQADCARAALEGKANE